MPSRPVSVGHRGVITTVLEPALVVLVAAVVLVVALLVFLPTWDMVTLLG